MAGTAGISREKVMLYLWPESDEERGRRALKQAIYSLRRDLGEELIVGTATLCLNASFISSDVADFEAALASGDLAAAYGLYRGSFLDGIHIRDSVEFERWSEEQRGRFALMWSRVAEQLAARHEERGEWREAADYRRAIAASDPLSSRHAAALMRTLAEAGDISAALRQYQIHESLLRGEMEATPDAEIVALADAMRGGTWRPSERPPARPAQPVAPPPAPEDATPAPVTPLPVPDAPPASAPTLQPVRPRSRRRRVLTVSAAGLLLLLSVATAWYGRLGPEGRAQLGVVVTRRNAQLVPRSIVVAPLENKTNDATLDVFGEQAEDWLIRELRESNFRTVDERTTRIGTNVVRRIPSFLRPRDPTIALAEETSAAFVLRGNYYRDGDSLEVALSVVDVRTRQLLKTFGPVKGSPRAPDAILHALIPPTLLYLRTVVDPSAGAGTMSQMSMPSFEAFERMSRAWEEFLSAPAETTLVFAELDSASTLDATYAAPILTRAYVLDVKQQWEDVEKAMKRARPLVANMSRFERMAFDVFEADLRGESMRRLQLSERMRDQSIGSTEVPLLSVASALYVGRPRDALVALRDADPDRGMNLSASIYWEWRSAAEHAAGLFVDEARSVETGLRRFPGSITLTFARARVLATDNDPSLKDFVARGVPSPKVGRGRLQEESPELVLFAGRELRAHGFAAQAQPYFREVAGTPAAAAIDPATANRDSVWRIATALYDAADYPRARRLLEALVHRDSLDIDAEGRLGTTAVRLGDLAAAARIDAHLAGLKRPFINGRHLRWRAGIAAAREQPDEAIALLDAAIRQGFRLIDTPAKLTIHLDADFVDIERSSAFASMLASLAAVPIR